MGMHQYLLGALGAAGLLASCVSAAPAADTSSKTGSSYKFSSVAITGGGFITGFVAHPTTPHLIYTRTDIGSAYRWDEAANQWIALTDFITGADINYMGTESIALDPTDPKWLYLAQGQYESQNNSAFFVSSDQGATFDIYPAPFTMGSNELGRNNGERLAVNPFKPTELYMGTRNAGLWKSSDRAKTWTNVTNFPDAALTQIWGNGIGLIFVIFDPLHEGTIYVGANSAQGLYVTTNGGTTWKALPGQPKDWSAVKTDPAHPPQTTGPVPMRAILASNGVLYVTYGDFPGPYAVQYGAVYSYNTKSSVWTNITPGVGNTFPAPYSLQPQAFPPGGFCGITVDGKDPNTLVVVSLDRDPGPALDSMYLSHDAGKTWKDVTQLSSPSGTNGYWGHPIQEAALDDGTLVPWLSFDWNSEWGGYGAPSPIVGVAKFGWWMAAVLIDPFDSDHLIYGTGATIWATDTLSRVDNNWGPTWYIKAQGIEETAVLALASPTEGAHLLSGLGDINGFAHFDLDKPQAPFGIPGFSNLDTLDWAGQAPNVIVRGGNSGVSYVDGCGTGTYSTDGGFAWTKFPACAPGIGNQSTYSGVIAVDASAKSFVWATTITTAPYSLTGPVSSQDFGVTWTAPKGLTFQTGNISSDKVQPKTFYAIEDGTFYVSTDGGLSYKSNPASKTGLPAGSGATPVVNFGKAGEIWLPLGKDGLYHSTDFGSSFKKIGPSGLVANLVTVGKAAPGQSNPAIFIYGKASTSGDLSAVNVYRSDDAGSSWVAVTDKAHQYGGAVLIQGDPRVYGRVYMGYFGRGIIYADLAGGNGANVPGTSGI